MNIILEGPDGSGKSTLAQLLSQRLDIPIRPGQGPEKYPGEVADRVREHYLPDKPGPFIYDRHPCVSHPIYSQFTGAQPLPDDLVKDFYSNFTGIFIYCIGLSSLVQEDKDYDTADHLEAIHRNHASICGLYHAWARDHAHLSFNRRYDDSLLTIETVNRLILLKS